ncbi:hypothetical protein WN48_00849 [Eufriesea mexicana]|nr:hypothetical protein WN48_00849 [Eufriesea mexicana]
MRSCLSKSTNIETWWTMEGARGFPFSSLAKKGIIFDRSTRIFEESSVEFRATSFSHLRTLCTEIRKKKKGSLVKVVATFFQEMSVFGVLASDL